MVRCAGNARGRSGIKCRNPTGINALVIGVVVLLSFSGPQGAYSNGILKLHHRFANRRSSTNDLNVYKAHDRRRHGRILANIDIPIGGSADPTGAGLYYAELAIGAPPKQYYVQVDTGSDILWVNCVPCSRCPKSSGLGVRLTLYDPSESTTGSPVMCNQQFCEDANQGQSIAGCTYNDPCPYGVQYGDGSSTTGYYVQDILQYNQVTGNFKTSLANASVIFGCGAQQTGELQSTDQAVDGILGFGQSNTSVLSQLANLGKTRKMFAHCLDGEIGGGILAIGHVVQPGLTMTPLVSNQPHYNVILKQIDVGGAPLPLDQSVFDTNDKQGTIIDSGTTLAYISAPAFKPLMMAIMSAGPSLEYTIQNGENCFSYDGSVDDVFPPVTFYFEGKLSMKVYAHEYLLSVQHGWCFGWQDSGSQTKENMYMTILGDLVLKDRLVVYDLENQTVGWVSHNCSSSIKVQDDKTGVLQDISAHHLSHGNSLELGKSSILISLLIVLCFNSIHGGI